MRCTRAWLSAALIVCGAVEAQAQGDYGTIKGRLVWGGSDDLQPQAEQVMVNAASRVRSMCVTR